MVIDSDFPGGNIVVESLEGSTARLRPDLRDSSTDWFYWYFRVRGAEGRTLNFIFDESHLGARGPAISVDSGVTWNWLGSAEGGAFAYSFPLEVAEVRFSVGMPYTLANWERFCLELREAGMPWMGQTLTRTPQGRAVPLVTAGNPNAAFAVVITARHHACEMMASYVLEGMMEAIGVNDEAGKWLCENAGFWVVPFMDLDGVEAGDQGKNRRPHDHNRDYAAESIYPEVRAVKSQLPDWLNGRPFVCLDLHCPALRGEVHESIFFIEPDDRRQAAGLDQLAEAWIGRQSGFGLLRRPYKLPFGSGFNQMPSSDKRTFAAWAAQLPNAGLCAGLEIAYANALGGEVNANSARRLGRDLAAALAVWIPQRLPSVELSSI